MMSHCNLCVLIAALACLGTSFVSAADLTVSVSNGQGAPLPDAIVALNGGNFSPPKTAPKAIID
ncbi:MAG: hypothetical protein ACI9DC_000314 [Gammaproteobacteria bacterium]|jgi:hypothetical protein